MMSCFSTKATFSLPQASGKRNRLSVAISGMVAAVICYCGTAAEADIIYFSNFDAGTVSQITPSGTTNTFASGFTFPEGLACDAGGNVYVASQEGPNGDGIVGKVTPDGTVNSFADLGALALISGLAFDKAGNLYASLVTSGKIDKITPAGVVTTFATGVGTPDGLAFDAAGNLYCADYSSQTGHGIVYRITRGGIVAPFATGLTGPVGLAFSSSGILYVGDNGTDLIDTVSSTGVVSTFVNLNSGTNGPNGIAFDSAGDLCVAESNLTRGGWQVVDVTQSKTIGTVESGSSGRITYIADVTSSSVPEPAAALIAPLAAVWALARRRST